MNAGMQIVVALPVLAATCGCGRERDESVDSAPVVYVDRETQQPVVLEGVVDAPAVNPATGRRTLTPGLYCPQCRTWHATPPLEVLQRNPAARRCPKCQSALNADGPHPTSDL